MQHIDKTPPQPSPWQGEGAVRRVGRSVANICRIGNGGYTRVILERLVGKGMLDGEWYWEISTSSIPPNLRNIGSRFLLSWQDTYNPGNLEEIRAAYADLPIVELLSE